MASTTFKLKKDVVGGRRICYYSFANQVLNLEHVRCTNSQCKSAHIEDLHPEYVNLLKN